MKNSLFFIFFLLSCQFVQAQVDSTNTNAVRLARKNLTYYWSGQAAIVVNTEFLYGFKMVYTGCVVTKEIEKHNRRVVRQINKVYGKGWFDKNKFTSQNTKIKKTKQ